jgi:hypothetical protein
MEKKWPDGATHYQPSTGLFYRLTEDQTWQFYVNAHHGWDNSADWAGRPSAPDSAIERPAPEVWTGQDGSLPPVGLKVEAYFPTDSKPTWLPTVLLYASDENVIYSGDEEGEEIRRSRADFNALQVKFRPIRTAEQIAAEERERDIATLVQFICADGAFGVDDPEVTMAAAKIHDAGYRKQVAK